MREEFLELISCPSVAGNKQKSKVMSLYCTETLAGDTPFSPEIKKRKIDRGVIKFVKGRDGSENPFDISKIENAVQKAFQSEHKTVPQPVISMIAKIVVSKVTNSQVINTVDIEKIQTSIEDTLMDLHYNDVAKHYILYREERAKHRKLYGKELKGVDDIKVPWGPLGYVTFKRTYARRFNEDDPNSSTEEYHDAVKRIVTACHTQLNVGFTVQEERRFAKYLLELKGCVGGRFLWQLGTRTVDKQGMASLQNCCFCTLEKIWDLCWIFDLLMCGAGVGFSVQQKHISKLPPVLDRQVIVKRLDTKDADFIVPDSREGWVRLLKEILTSYFVTGTSFSYSTILIRGKGTPIKGFGGTASGPEELCKRMSQICDLLDKHRGRQLGSVDCLDTVNMIAALVVSGNVRRSALIALGDCWDIDYIKAKWWKLGPEKVPDHRAMSNNSVVCDDVRKLPPEFWEGYTGGAEPYGLINLNLTRKIGRLSDGEKYPDPGVEGFNPCAEQGLDNYETCTLAEVFLPNLTSHDEAIDMIKMLYRVCKHSLLLSFHHKDSEDVVHKNMRMGIGITGYCQASEEQKSWLPGIYEELRRYDIEYSTKLGCPISIKLTTCKPSGTLSLFPNHVIVT